MNIATKATITVSALLSMDEIANALQATVRSEAFKGDTSIESLKVVSASVKLVDGNSAEVELVFAKADEAADAPDVDKAANVAGQPVAAALAPAAPIAAPAAPVGLSLLPVG